MTKHILYFFILMTLCQNGYNQGVTRSLNIPDIPLGVDRFFWGKSEEGFSLYLSSFSTSGFAIVNFMQDGSIENAFRVQHSNSDFLANYFPTVYRRRGDWHAVSQKGQPNGFESAGTRLFIINTSAGEQMAWRLSETHFLPFRHSFVGQNLLLTQHGMGQENNIERLQFAQIDVSTREILWSKSYGVTGFSNVTISFLDEELLPNGNVVGMGGLLFGDGSHNYNFLIELNQAGEIVRSILHENTMSFKKIGTDNQGNIFLIGASNNAAPIPNDAILAKLSPAFELIWSKQLHAENFDYLNTTLQTDSTGDVYFSYSTFGDLPVIAGKISAAGELLWYNGYAAHNPQILIDDALRFYITSDRQYSSDGSFQDARIIMRTDEQGLLGDCEVLLLALN
ncbi:MAG: hypothetical protein R2795_04735 [Saprospiraceae bacterium]